MGKKIEEGKGKEVVYLLGVTKTAGLDESAKAIHFAVKAHGDKLRDDGKTKTYEHPIRVGRMVRNLGTPLKKVLADDVTLAASFLHDTDEDEDVTINKIREKFGNEVAHLVDLLTKRKGMTLDEYYKRISGDVRAIFIKAVDRVCNVDDAAEVYGEERLIRYVNETEKYILPMMKDAREDYLEYSDPLIVLRDYINGILRSAKKIIKLYQENSKLKMGNNKLKKKLKEKNVKA